MRLGIEDILVETDQRRLRKDQVEILERLRQPERFHAVGLGGVSDRDIVQRCMGDCSPCLVDDGGEHVPGSFLKGWVSGDAVHDEDGLDRFGPVVEDQMEKEEGA